MKTSSALNVFFKDKDKKIAPSSSSTRILLSWQNISFPFISLAFRTESPATNTINFINIIMKFLLKKVVVILFLPLSCWWRFLSSSLPSSFNFICLVSREERIIAFVFCCNFFFLHTYRLSFTTLITYGDNQSPSSARLLLSSKEISCPSKRITWILEICKARVETSRCTDEVSWI